VIAAPVVNAISNQTRLSGTVTAPINFTGTAKAYDWVNDKPGIGLAATGIGNIPSFTAVNNGANTVTATITVTPKSQGAGCDGIPVRFTITVNPPPRPTITATGNPSPLNTI
jgi:hypothetical protein